MKRILFLCCFLLTGFASFAETSHETTTDHVTLSQVTLNPGGEYATITASVENISSYTAFGLDICLPQGYEFVQLQLENADEELEWMYAKKGAACKTTHSVKSNIQEDGSLRVTAYSSSSATFKTTSTELFTFFVKATTYAKPGVADVQIKNCFFTTAEGVQYDTEDETISDKLSASTSATASLTFSGTTHWSTLVLPFDAELPTGVRAYTCTEKDDVNKVLKLKSAASIAAYTPYVMYAESDYSGTLSGTVDASDYPSNGYVTSGYLNGAITKQSITTGYVLQNGSEGVMFYSCGGDSFTIPAGKCWVNITSGEAKGYGFSFEELSGIGDVNADVTPNANIYNLAGQRVSSDAKGIIIINGKKILK